VSPDPGFGNKQTKKGFASVRFRYYTKCKRRLFRHSERMEVRFEDPALRRLEEDPTYTHGLDAALVKVFRTPPW